jgi:putative tryptophan/tyrosine transport system substrate-binding protein
MRRREFITAFGAAAVFPIAANAQQTVAKHVGALVPYLETDTVYKTRLQAFKQRLQELGWVENRNLTIEYRWTGGDASNIQAAAQELAGMRLDLVLAVNPPAAMALKQQTHSIPVVFVNVADAVGSGLVQDLARPGGNLTGFTNFEFSIAGKWLELLKQVAGSAAWPLAARAQQPPMPVVGILDSAGNAAPSFRKGLYETGYLEGRNVAIELRSTEQYGELPALATELVRLAAAFISRQYAQAGGLMTYGASVVDSFQQAGVYAGRILRGEMPGDLPVMQPTRFELVINLQAAKAIGLDVPLPLLQLADEVIE